MNLLYFNAECEKIAKEKQKRMHKESVIGKALDVAIIAACVVASAVAIVFMTSVF